jgi:O-antigen biosynthesis protein WbqP
MTSNGEKMYKCFLKRVIDIILSSIAIVILALPMLIIAIIIKIDSPGPVLFKQKRIGIHKKHFTILKFRSMPVSAPKDTPTHQLQNADAMLSKWQKFIRKSSVDELPQLFCIFVGTMSIIGPRPALWNQFDLIEERDTYGANDVLPGLTGWAQINGRDELEIPVKAKFDGEYTAALNAGKFKGFAMDIKCFFGTIVSVLKSDGVVEGGTGEMKKQEEKKEEETV